MHSYLTISLSTEMCSQCPPKGVCQDSWHFYAFQIETFISQCC